MRFVLRVFPRPKWRLYSRPGVAPEVGAAPAEGLCAARRGGDERPWVGRPELLTATAHASASRPGAHILQSAT